MARAKYMRNTCVAGEVFFSRPQQQSRLNEEPKIKEHKNT